jgi:hypothetical protein
MTLQGDFNAPLTTTITRWLGPLPRDQKAAPEVTLFYLTCGPQSIQSLTYPLHGTKIGL